MCYHQIETFAVSKDEWNTKEDTGKSMKNALYVLQYAQRHPFAWSNVEQWKNLSLYLKVSGRQLVPSNYIF